MGDTMRADTRVAARASWMRIVQGALAAVLLLPVPLYAAGVLYNSGAWTLTTSGFTPLDPDPFSTVTGTTSNAGLGFGTPTLTYALSQPSYTNVSGIVTLTSPNLPAYLGGGPGGAVVPGGIGIANAAWSTLGNIYSISPASSIQVTISFGRNNMFSGNYGNIPNPDSLTLGNGTYQIKVTFTFSHASFSATSTPWTLTFS